MQNQYYDQLKKTLLLLGISDFDANVYLAALKKGSASISYLSRELQVERPTIYSSLERLESKNLIPSTRAPYMRTIDIEPPSRILSLLEKQKADLSQEENHLENIMPEVMASFAEKGRLSSFRLFEGREQFLTIFEESLKEADREILFYGNAAEFIRFEGLEYEKNWIKKRLRRNISIRMIIHPFDQNESELKNIEKTDKKELRTTKYLLGDHPFKSSYMIYGFQTVLWNPTAERAVVLNDPVITEMFEQTFETLWKITQ